MIESSISIILPTYNRANLLKRSIISVLNQIEEDDELIIVDDGSTDETMAVVSEFANRLRYFRTDNRGAGAARNMGIRKAQKSYVAFIDSDDEWLPGKIKIQRAFMRSMPNILFCFTNFCFRETQELGGSTKHFNLISWSKDKRSWDEILGKGRPISDIIDLPKGMDDFQFHVGSMCKLELTANYINVNTLIVRRIDAHNALHFAEDTPTYEDWECFGRLSCAGKAAYLDIETACQHSHGGSRLTDAHVTECAQSRVKIIPRVWGSSESFLEKHQELYKKTLTKEISTLIDGLLVRGEIEKARIEIKKIKKSIPFSRIILAMMPAIITNKIISIRRWLKY